MAQLNPEIYKKIVLNFSRCVSQMENANDWIHEAEIDITNITTTGYHYPEGATAAEEANNAIEVTMALLQPVHNAYVGVSGLVGSTTSLIQAVKVVNDYVISHITVGVGEQTLGAYVQAIYWVDDAYISGDEGIDIIPPQWLKLTADAGYSVTSAEFGATSYNVYAAKYGIS